MVPQATYLGKRYEVIAPKAGKKKQQCCMHGAVWLCCAIYGAMWQGTGLSRGILGQQLKYEPTVGADVGA